MSDTTPTLAVATEFIASYATEEDLGRVLATVKQRRAALAAIRAASLTTGSTVTIANISPKYLNGLTGQIARIDGRSATVTLDADSTDRLRYTSQTRLAVPADATSFELPGVPLTCCLPAS